MTGSAMDVEQSNGHVVVNNGESSNDGGMEDDSVEYQVMRAYASRRRPGIGRDIPDHAAARNPAPSLTPAPREMEIPEKSEKKEKKEKKKKKKKKKKNGVNKFLRLFKCGTHVADEQMQNGEEEDLGPQTAHFRCMTTDDDRHADTEQEIEEVASKLVKITDGIPIRLSEIECDVPEDKVEKLVGLLLRECGDRHNTEVLKDGNLARELFGNYSLFERVMTTFLTRLGLGLSDPDSPDPQGSPKAQIALTCEATYRLSAADSRPMSHLVGFGAKYLKKHFSTWVAQHGGYVEALGAEEDDEVE